MSATTEPNVNNRMKFIFSFQSIVKKILKSKIIDKLIVELGKSTKIFFFSVFVADKQE